MHYLLVLLLSFFLMVESLPFQKLEASNQVNTGNFSTNIKGTPIPYIYPVAELSNPAGTFSLIITYTVAVIVAAMGTMLAITCIQAALKRPSITLFVLVSAIYIIGEIYSTLKFKNLAKEAMTINLNNTQEVDIQLRSFKTLLDQHKSYDSVLKIKFYVTLAAVAGYSGATAIAILEGLYDWWKGPVDLGPQNKCIMTQVSAPIVSTPFFKWLNNFHLNTLYAADSGTPLPTPTATSGTSFFGMSFDFSKIVKLLLVGGGVLIGGAFGAAMYKAPTIRKSVQGIFGHVLVRIVFFAVMAGVTAYLAYNIYNQRKTLANQITYLETIIAKLSEDRSSYNSPLSLASLEPTPIIPPIPLASEVQTAIASANGSCFNAVQSSLQFDPSCECAKTNSCSVTPQSTFTKTLSPTTTGTLPSTLSTIGNTTSNALSELSKGNLSGALGELSNIINKAADIKGMTKKLEKHYNDSNKTKTGANSAAPLDIDKAAQTTFEELKKPLITALESQGYTQDNLSSWGNGPGGDIPSLSHDAGGNLSQNKEIEFSGNEAMDRAALEKLGIGKGDPASLSSSLPNLSDQNVLPPVIPNGTPEGDFEASSRQGFFGNQGEKEKNIFDMLSYRYSVTGQKRLLEEK